MQCIWLCMHLVYGILDLLNDKNVEKVQFSKWSIPKEGESY